MKLKSSTKKKATIKSQERKQNKEKTKKEKKPFNVFYSVETRDSTVTRSTGIEADTALCVQVQIELPGWQVLKHEVVQRTDDN